MVIHELSCLGIFTIAFFFRTERADHLRVTVDTSFADINITAVKLQGRVGFYTRQRWHIRLNEECWYHFDESPDQDGHKGEDGEYDGFVLQYAMVPSGSARRGVDTC